MNYTEVLEYVGEHYPEAVKIDGFEEAIIGFSYDGQLVYDYDLMVKAYVNKATKECSEEEAIEFIGYNTMRALPYIPESVRPIVIYTLSNGNIE